MKPTVQHAVVVDCDARRAWQVFTQHVDQWWPGGHRVLPDSRLELTPERLVERNATDEKVWGEVLEWTPGKTLRLRWFMGNAVTHAHITFTPEGDGTRVAVQHTPGPSDLAGPAWQKRAVRFDAGWTALLGAFSEVA